MGTILGQPVYYAGTSLNQLSVSYLNPYSDMIHYYVKIMFRTAIVDLEEEEIVTPDYELSDFLKWARHLRSYFEDEDDSAFSVLFEALKGIAISRIRYKNILDEGIWKRLVSMYIGHYIELTNRIWKDEANRASLNPYEKEKDYHYEMSVGNVVFEEFKTTSFGAMFWLEFEPIGRFDSDIWGCY